jgi:hypothetical protein
MGSKFSPNKLQVIEILDKIKKLTKADFFARASSLGHQLLGSLANYPG